MFTPLGLTHPIIAAGAKGTDCEEHTARGDEAKPIENTLFTFLNLEPPPSLHPSTHPPSIRASIHPPIRSFT